MSNKFKVGDIVECTSSKYSCVTKGEPHTVVSVYGESISFKNNDNEILYYPHEDFKLIEKVESEKWHTHHDLIIKWLSSKDMVVDFKFGGEWRLASNPDWCPESQYRVYHKDTTPEQLEIEDVKHQIERLQDKLNKLEAVHGK